MHYAELHVDMLMYLSAAAVTTTAAAMVGASEKKRVHDNCFSFPPANGRFLQPMTRVTVQSDVSDAKVQTAEKQVLTCGTWDDFVPRIPLFPLARSNSSSSPVPVPIPMLSPIE